MIDFYPFISEQRDAATGVPDPPPAPAPDAEQPQNVAKRRRSSLESQGSYLLFFN